MANSRARWRAPFKGAALTIPEDLGGHGSKPRCFVPDRPARAGMRTGNCCSDPTASPSRRAPGAFAGSAMPAMPARTGAASSTRRGAWARRRKAAAWPRRALATGPGDAVCGIGPRQRRPHGADRRCGGRPGRLADRAPACVFRGRRRRPACRFRHAAGDDVAPLAQMHRQMTRPARRRRIDTEGRTQTNERDRKQTDTWPQAAWG
jgi:hypothetical protein